MEEREARVRVREPVYTHMATMMRQLEMMRLRASRSRYVLNRFSFRPGPPHTSALRTQYTSRLSAQHASGLRTEGLRAQYASSWKYFLGLKTQCSSELRAKASGLGQSNLQG
jgi:hypothetical protein